MTFIIDTGLPDNDPKRLLPDWFLDQFEDDADTATVLRAYAQHIIGSMDRKVRVDNARKNLLMAWRFLQELAETDPASFDAVLTEYAGKVFEHACASAPAVPGIPTPPIGQSDKGKQDEPVF